MELAAANLHSLGLCLEGFLFGLYSGIFAIYLQHNFACKARTDGVNSIVYAHCALYLLSAAVITLDIVKHQLFTDNISMVYHLENTAPSAAVFACCDLVAQLIFIHRCWIVWGRNIWIVVIPSLLAFAYLVVWIATIGTGFIVQGGVDETFWGELALASLTESMIVNALTTSLTLLRIFKVFCQLKRSTTADERSLGVTRGGRLRAVIFIVIETQMTLFAIQLARLAITISPWMDFKILSCVFDIIVRVHKMLNGITPTIVLVRVLTTLHFYESDESSLESESEDGNSLHTIELDSIPEMLNTDQEWRDDIIDKSYDPQMPAER